MDPLTSPDAFLRRESDDPRLLPPVVIVLAAALLGAAGQYILFSTLLGSIGSGGQTGGIATLVTTVSIVFGFAFTFVLWFLYAGVFYLLSMIFDGEGSFVTTLKLVGWGYLPSVVSAAVTAIAYWVVLDGRGSVSQPGFGASATSVLSGPTLWVITAVGLVFTLWQGALFAFAVRHARNLSLRQAALVVSPVILLSVAASVFSLVGSGL